MSQSSVEYLGSISPILYNRFPSLCVGAFKFTQSGLVILAMPWVPQILYRTDCLSLYTEAFPLFRSYTNIYSALRCFLHSVDHRHVILVFMSSLFPARLLPLYKVCVSGAFVETHTAVLLWANIWFLFHWSTCLFLCHYHAGVFSFVSYHGSAL